MHSERRKRVLDAMGPRAVAVLPTAPVYIRNNDVEHDFRPDSDVFYLTGFDEPESVLVLLPGHAQHPCVLFVRPRDAEREVWNGARAGIDGARAQYGADAAFPIDELDARLPDLLSDRARLYYALGRDRAFDDRVLNAVATTRRSKRKGGDWPTEIVDPATVVHEMRLVKDETELASMRRAAEITRDAFVRALDLARPGRVEYEIEGAMRDAFRSRGSERPAYAPIIASGPNACVLHYVANKRRLEDGDLLLIDAGAEYDGYASDVTRTLPVNGRYTPAQKAIYQLVLDAQLASIACVKPGATLPEVHDASVRVITEGLVKLGILTGEVDRLIEDATYRKYFMHGTSHWLGMDVHDVGRYYGDDGPRKLEPGCVLTVEPGVYIPVDDDAVPPEFRGIGVRIEDDVACTAEGHRVLTHDIPKNVDEIESLMARRSGTDRARMSVTV